MGLSPFARGNLELFPIFPEKTGPIPVRTGEPFGHSEHSAIHRAYPRSHWGTTDASKLSSTVWGLSPFARGNRTVPFFNFRGRGPIPVRTGEPNGGVPLSHAGGAYPRSHGGTDKSFYALIIGSGLSPFARGNLKCARLAKSTLGPIPVRTGEPDGRGLPHPCWWAYPRSHGGTAASVATLTW